MRKLRAMAVIACLACAGLRAADDDPREIVRRALRINQHNSELARAYTFIQHRESRTLDGSGAVTKRERETWDVTRLEGSTYWRLTERDGKPLSAKEEAEQQKSLKKSEEARRKETPEQRQKRVDGEERQRKQQQEELAQVPDAFDFRLVGEERIDGVDVWVIDGTPRKGYHLKSNAAAYLSKIRGRIWIAKSDYEPVKIDAETTDTISVGAFLARIHKGFHIHVENTRVNGEVWLPKFVSIAGSARVLLVKGLRIDRDFAYSNYRKFSAESRVIE